MKKTIIKVITYIVLCAFSFQNIVWADPGLIQHKAFDANLQVPNLFQNQSAVLDQSLLEAALIYVLEQVPSGQDFKYRLAPTFKHSGSSITVDLDLSRQKHNDGRFLIPCKGYIRTSTGRQTISAEVGVHVEAGRRDGAARVIIPCSLGKNKGGGFFDAVVDLSDDGQSIEKIEFIEHADEGSLLMSDSREQDFQLSELAYQYKPDTGDVSEKDINDLFETEIKARFIEVNRKISGELGVRTVIDEDKIKLDGSFNAVLPVCGVNPAGEVIVNAEFVKVMVLLKNRIISGGLRERLTLVDEDSGKSSDILSSIIYSVILHELTGHFKFIDGKVVFSGDGVEAQRSRGAGYSAINFKAMLFFWLAVCEKRAEDIEYRAEEFLTLNRDRFRIHGEPLSDIRIKKIAGELRSLADAAGDAIPDSYISTGTDRYKASSSLPEDFVFNEENNGLMKEGDYLRFLKIKFLQSLNIPEKKAQEYAVRIYDLHETLREKIDAHYGESEQQLRYTLTPRELRRATEEFIRYFGLAAETKMLLQDPLEWAFDHACQNVYYDSFPAEFFNDGQIEESIRDPMGDEAISFPSNKADKILVSRIESYFNVYAKLSRGMDAGKPVLFIKDKNAHNIVEKVTDIYVRAKEGVLVKVPITPFSNRAQIIGTQVPKKPMTAQEADIIIADASVHDMKWALAIIRERVPEGTEKLPEKELDKLIGIDHEEWLALKGSHIGLKKAVASALVSGWAWSEKLGYADGALARMSITAAADPDRDYYLYFDNVDAASPKVRAQLNQILLFGFMEIPEKTGDGHRLEIPRNLHLIFTMSGSSELEDAAFYDRFLRKHVDGLWYPEAIHKHGKRTKGNAGASADLSKYFPRKNEKEEQEDIMEILHLVYSMSDEHAVLLASFWEDFTSSIRGMDAYNELNIGDLFTIAAYSKGIMSDLWTDAGGAIGGYSIETIAQECWYYMRNKLGEHLSGPDGQKNMILDGALKQCVQRIQSMRGSRLFFSYDDKYEIDADSHRMMVNGVYIDIDPDIRDEDDLYRKTGLVLTSETIRVLGAMIREDLYGHGCLQLKGPTGTGKTFIAEAYSKLTSTGPDRRLSGRMFYCEPIHSASKLDKWLGYYRVDTWGDYPFFSDTEFREALKAGGIVAASELNTRVSKDGKASLAYWLVPKARGDTSVPLTEQPYDGDNVDGYFPDLKLHPRSMVVIDINPHEGYAARGEIPDALEAIMPSVYVAGQLSMEDLKVLIKTFLGDASIPEKRHISHFVAYVHSLIQSEIQKKKLGQGDNYVITLRELHRTCEDIVRMTENGMDAMVAADIAVKENYMNFWIKKKDKTHVNNITSQARAMLLKDVGRPPRMIEQKKVPGLMDKENEVFTYLRDSLIEAGRPTMLLSPVDSRPEIIVDKLADHNGLNKEKMTITYFTELFNLVGGFVPVNHDMRLEDAYSIISRVNDVDAGRVADIWYEKLQMTEEDLNKAPEDHIITLATVLNSLSRGEEWNAKLEWREGFITRIVRRYQEGDEKALLVLDNYHRLRPKVAVALNELLQGRKMHLADGSTLELPSNISILALAGTSFRLPISPAEQSRWVRIVSDELENEEKKKLLEQEVLEQLGFDGDHVVDNKTALKARDLASEIADAVKMERDFLDRVCAQEEYYFSFWDDIALARAIAENVKVSGRFSKERVKEALTQERDSVYAVALASKELNAYISNLTERMSRGRYKKRLENGYLSLNGVMYPVADEELEASTRDSRLIEIPRLMVIERSILRAFGQNRMVVLEGPPGGGKTDTAEDIANSLGLESFLFSSHDRVHLSDFIGEFTQNEEGNYMLTSIPDDTLHFHVPFLDLYTHGGVYIIDEGAIGRRAQELIAWLGPLARGEKELYLQEHPGAGVQRLERHPDFHIVITTNPYKDTPGREAIPFEVLSYAQKIWVDKNFTQGDFKMILRKDISRLGLGSLSQSTLIDRMIYFHFSVERCIGKTLGVHHEERFYIGIRELRRWMSDFIRIYEALEKKSIEFAFIEAMKMNYSIFIDPDEEAQFRDLVFDCLFRTRIEQTVDRILDDVQKTTSFSLEPLNEVFDAYQVFLVDEDFRMKACTGINTRIKDSLGVMPEFSVGQHTHFLQRRVEEQEEGSREVTRNFNFSYELLQVYFRNNDPDGIRIADGILDNISSIMEDGVDKERDRMRQNGLMRWRTLNLLDPMGKRHIEYVSGIFTVLIKLLEIYGRFNESDKSKEAAELISHILEQKLVEKLDLKNYFPVALKELFRVMKDAPASSRDLITDSLTGYLNDTYLGSDDPEMVMIGLEMATYFLSVQEEPEEFIKALIAKYRSICDEHRARGYQYPLSAFWEGLASNSRSLDDGLRKVVLGWIEEEVFRKDPADDAKSYYSSEELRRMLIALGEAHISFDDERAAHWFRQALHVLDVVYADLPGPRDLRKKLYIIESSFDQLNKEHDGNIEERLKRIHVRKTKGAPELSHQDLVRIVESLGGISSGDVKNEDKEKLLKKIFSGVEASEELIDQISKSYEARNVYIGLAESVSRLPDTDRARILKMIESRCPDSIYDTAYNMLRKGVGQLDLADFLPMWDIFLSKLALDAPDNTGLVLRSYSASADGEKDYKELMSILDGIPVITGNRKEKKEKMMQLFPFFTQVLKNADLLDQDKGRMVAVAVFRKFSEITLKNVDKDLDAAQKISFYELILGIKRIISSGSLINREIQKMHESIDEVTDSANKSARKRMQLDVQDENGNVRIGYIRLPKGKALEPDRVPAKVPWVEGIYSEDAALRFMANSFASRRPCLFFTQAGSRVKVVIDRICQLLNWELHKINCYADMNVNDLIGGLSPILDNGHNGRKKLKQERASLSSFLVEPDKRKGPSTHRVLVLYNIDFLSEKVRAALHNFLLKGYIYVTDDAGKRVKLVKPDSLHIVTTMSADSDKEIADAFYSRFNRTKLPALEMTRKRFSELEVALRSLYGLSMGVSRYIAKILTGVMVFDERSLWPSGQHYGFCVKDAFALARYFVEAREQCRREGVKMTDAQILCQEAMRLFGSAVSDTGCGPFKKKVHKTSPDISDRSEFERLVLKGTFSRQDLQMPSQKILLDQKGRLLELADVPVNALPDGESIFEIDPAYRLSFIPSLITTTGSLLRAWQPAWDNFQDLSGTPHGPDLVIMTGETGVAKTTLGINISKALGKDSYVYPTHQGSRAWDLTVDVAPNGRGGYYARVKDFARMAGQGNCLLVIDEGNIKSQLVQVLAPMARGEKELQLVLPGEGRRLQKVLLSILNDTGDTDVLSERLRLFSADLIGTHEKEFRRLLTEWEALGTADEKKSFIPKFYKFAMQLPKSGPITVTLGSNTFILVTQNPESYAGRDMIDPIIQNDARKIWASSVISRKEALAIVNSFFGILSPVVLGSLSMKAVPDDYAYHPPGYFTEGPGLDSYQLPQFFPFAESGSVLDKMRIAMRPEEQKVKRAMIERDVAYFTNKRVVVLPGETFCISADGTKIWVPYKQLLYSTSEVITGSIIHEFRHQRYSASYVDIEMMAEELMHEERITPSEYKNLCDMGKDRFLNMLFQLAENVRTDFIREPGFEGENDYLETFRKEKFMDNQLDRFPDNKRTKIKKKLIKWANDFPDQAFITELANIAYFDRTSDVFDEYPQELKDAVKRVSSVFIESTRSDAVRPDFEKVVSEQDFEQEKRRAVKEFALRIVKNIVPVHREMVEKAMPAYGNEEKKAEASFEKFAEYMDPYIKTDNDSGKAPSMVRTRTESDLADKVDQVLNRLSSLVDNAGDISSAAVPDAGAGEYEACLRRMNDVLREARAAASEIAQMGINSMIVKHARDQRDEIRRMMKQVMDAARKACAEKDENSAPEQLRSRKEKIEWFSQEIDKALASAEQAYKEIDQDLSLSRAAASERVLEEGLKLMDKRTMDMAVQGAEPETFGAAYEKGDAVQEMIDEIDSFVGRKQSGKVRDKINDEIRSAMTVRQIADIKARADRCGQAMESNPLLEQVLEAQVELSRMLGRMQEAITELADASAGGNAVDMARSVRQDIMDSIKQAENMVRDVRSAELEGKTDEQRAEEIRSMVESIRAIRSETDSIRDAAMTKSAPEDLVNCAKMLGKKLNDLQKLTLGLSNMGADKGQLLEGQSTRNRVVSQMDEVTDLLKQRAEKSGRQAENGPDPLTEILTKVEELVAQSRRIHENITTRKEEASVQEVRDQLVALYGNMNAAMGCLHDAAYLGAPDPVIYPILTAYKEIMEFSDAVLWIYRDLHKNRADENSDARQKWIAEISREYEKVSNIMDNVENTDSMMQIVLLERNLTEFINVLNGRLVELAALGIDNKNLQRILTNRGRLLRRLMNVEKKLREKHMSSMYGSSSNDLETLIIKTMEAAGKVAGGLDASSSVEELGAAMDKLRTSYLYVIEEMLARMYSSATNPSIIKQTVTARDDIYSMMDRVCEMMRVHSVGKDELAEERGKKIAAIVKLWKQARVEGGKINKDATIKQLERAYASLYKHTGAVLDASAELALSGCTADEMEKAVFSRREMVRISDSIGSMMRDAVARDNRMREEPAPSGKSGKKGPSRPPRQELEEMLTDILQKAKSTVDSILASKDMSKSIKGGMKLLVQQISSVDQLIFLLSRSGETEDVVCRVNETRGLLWDYLKELAVLMRNENSRSGMGSGKPDKKARSLKSILKECESITSDVTEVSPPPVLEAVMDNIRREIDNALDIFSSPAGGSKESSENKGVAELDRMYSIFDDTGVALRKVVRAYKQIVPPSPGDMDGASGQSDGQDFNNGQEMASSGQQAGQGQASASGQSMSQSSQASAGRGAGQQSGSAGNAAQPGKAGVSRRAGAAGSGMSSGQAGKGAPVKARLSDIAGKDRERNEEERRSLSMPQDDLKNGENEKNGASDRDSAEDGVGDLEDFKKKIEQDRLKEIRENDNLRSRISTGSDRARKDANQIIRLFKQRDADVLQEESTTGLIINVPRFIRGDPESFDIENEHLGDVSLSFGLYVDNSGSISQIKEYVSDAVAYIIHLFEGIMGTHSGRDKFSYAIKTFDTGMNSFKEFDEKITKQELSSIPLNLRDALGYGGTEIGLCIENIMEDFSDVKEETKVAILITDGQDDVPPDLAKKAAKKGITLIGIGVGAYSENVRNIFERYMIFSNPKNELPEALVKIASMLAVGKKLPTGNLLKELGFASNISEIVPPEEEDVLNAQVFPKFNLSSHGDINGSGPGMIPVARKHIFERYGIDLKDQALFEQVLFWGLSLLPGLGNIPGILSVWAVFFASHFIRTDGVKTPPLRGVLAVTCENAFSLAAISLLYRALPDVTILTSVVFITFMITSWRHYMMNMRYLMREDTGISVSADAASGNKGMPLLMSPGEEDHGVKGPDRRRPDPGMPVVPGPGEQGPETDELAPGRGELLVDTAPPFMRDITDEEESSRNFIEAVLSACISKGKGKVVLAFHSELTSYELGGDRLRNDRIWNLIREMRKLKDKKGFKELLEDLVIVDSFNDLNASLCVEGIDPEDKDNLVFMFAPLSRKGRLANCPAAAKGVFIEHAKDKNGAEFDPMEFYYPLFEIVTITLIKHLGMMDESDIDLTDINIENVDDRSPDSYLVFTVIPAARAHRTGERMDRYTLIRRYLDAAV